MRPRPFEVTSQVQASDTMISEGVKEAMQVTFVVFLVLLFHQSGVTLSQAVTNEETARGNSTVPKPIVLHLSIVSDIRFRYAHTAVSSRISNPANISQEVGFSVVLPDSAFISGFHIVVDDVLYESYVREREAARQEYVQAVAEGKTAAHVALSARDSKRFTVSVNVEPEKKINFKLLYEELLTRQLGTYKHVINLDPGQIVNVLKVTTRIKESNNITILKVPALRTSNEILEEPSEATNPLVTIERPTSDSAVVKFWPTQEQQRELSSEGIQGQLVVEYDVDRKSRPGEVLVSDGYFVHFFAPEELPPLRKHVTFVLDVSGSMSGRKIEQLKQAMCTILDDLNNGDLFSIVPFSSTVQVWDHNATELELRSRRQRLGEARWGDYGEEEEQAETLAPTVIAPANDDNIQKAKSFVNELSANGATNINEALVKALQISKLGRQNSTTSTESNDLQQGAEVQRPEPIIIFLTDGKANIAPSEPNVIISNVKRANTGNSSIFSLALGGEADFPFLNKISIRNTGFARKIYEASDTALQLKNFYKQIASPLLANVTFKYQPDQVDRNSVTRSKFRRIFGGSEVVVSGRLQIENFTSEVKGQSSSGNSSYSFAPTSLLPPPPTPDTNTTVTSMERLWAYLTIQQLLNKQEAITDYNETDYTDYDDYGESDDSNSSALALALRYSFVTPLTSLVVVKPNENASSVSTEDASEQTTHIHSGSVLRMAFSRPAATPPIYNSADSIRSASIGSPFTGGPHPLPAPIVEVENLSDVTWLSPKDNTISLPTGINGTNEVLHLAAANETNVAYATCTTPRGESGHCRHFKYCVLNVFTNNQTLFIPYFCRINSFLGVCCPDHLQAAVN